MSLTIGWEMTSHAGDVQIDTWSTVNHAIFDTKRCSMLGRLARRRYIIICLGRLARRSISISAVSPLLRFISSISVEALPDILKAQLVAERGRNAGPKTELAKVPQMHE